MTARPRPASSAVPEPPASEFDAPRASIDPDHDKPWWRRLAPIVRTHRGMVVTGLGCSLLAMLLQIAIPRLIRMTVDEAVVPALTGAGPGRPLSSFFWLVAGVATVRFGVGFVARYNLQRASLAIDYDLRNILYRKFTSLSFSYFDRVQSGQLISRANSDIRTIQMFLAFAPAVALSVITFVVAFSLMVSTSLTLALVAVATLPGVYLTGSAMRSKLFPLSWIVASRQAEVATVVEENITGTRVVKAFAAEGGQIRRLARAAERLRWGSVLQVDVRARYSPWLHNLPRLGIAMVLLYGGKLAIDGRVTIGTLIEFNAYVLMLQAPFMMLGFLLTLGQRAAASAARIFEIVDEVPEIVERPGAIDLPDASGDVRFESVVFSYGAAEAPVLEGFDLHLQQGETVALVGRTGSGKSTVGQLIPRFYDVQQGAVLIGGHDVRDLTLGSLRAQVGLVLDEPFLFSDTIRNNIAYGRPDATDEDVEEASTAAGASEFVERLPDGYQTVIGERGYTLSGGQRQRLAIARTLLVNPRILILDDATSAVDAQVEHEIHDALRTLAAGRTTVVISHRLSTISLAQRVVLLQNGRIAAEGSHDQLMALVPEYAEVLAQAGKPAGDPRPAASSTGRP